MATIAAFANGLTRGTLSTGFSDKERNIVGVKNVKKANEEHTYTNKVQLLEPRIYFEIELYHNSSMYVILSEICLALHDPIFVKATSKEKQAYNLVLGLQTRAAGLRTIK